MLAKAIFVFLFFTEVLPRFAELAAVEGDLPHWPNGVLDPAHERALGAGDVLEKEDLPARLEHAVDLAQHLLYVPHRAEHVRDDDLQLLGNGSAIVIDACPALLLRMDRLTAAAD